jgi:hypothetical protein
MAARQILSRAVEFINQIDDFLDALNMAQFLQRIFAKPLKLSKTILDLWKIVIVQLFKSLQLHDIKSIKEISDICLVAQNIFEIKVFLNVVFQ